MEKLKGRWKWLDSWGNEPQKDSSHQKKNTPYSWGEDPSLCGHRRM